VFKFIANFVSLLVSHFIIVMSPKDSMHINTHKFIINAYSQTH